MRSTVGQPLSASDQHLPNWQEALGWGGGGREGGMEWSTPSTQLWPAVFTSRPQGALCVYVAWLLRSSCPFKLRHTSPKDWPQIKVTGRNGSNSPMGLGFQLQLFSYFGVIGPKLVVLMSTLFDGRKCVFWCFFPFSAAANIIWEKQTDWLTYTEFL